MDRQYTESFTINAGGWTGGANAILNSTTSGVTAGIRLWRDSGDPRQISLAPGQILPLKVRHVQCGVTLTGFN